VVVALLLILFALFGFAFAGFSSGSSHTAPAKLKPQVVRNHGRNANGNACSNRMTTTGGADSGQCRIGPVNP
jgi:hypothetical protein